MKHGDRAVPAGPPGFSRSPSRPGNDAGGLITIAALVLGVVSATVIGMSMGRPMYESLTNDPRSVPFDAKLSLRSGRYTVFQLTGRESVRGPLTTLGGNAAPITAQDVQVTAPDGHPVAVLEFGSNSEEMRRNGGDVYTGMVRFTTPAAGVYHVRIGHPAGSPTIAPDGLAADADPPRVIVAPAFGSGFSTALPWILAGLTSAVIAGIGVIVLIAGAVQRRQRPVPRTTWGPATPAQGWYPAPDEPGRQRYWDGKGWTQHSR